MQGLNDGVYYLVMYAWHLALYCAFVAVFCIFGGLIGLKVGATQWVGQRLLQAAGCGCRLRAPRAGAMPNYHAAAARIPRRSSS